MLALNDIMTSDVVALSPDLSLRDAMDLLTARHISGAPVVSRNHVVGVVSLTDLAEFATQATKVPSLHPGDVEWNALEEHTVSDVMSTNVASLPADTAVEAAAAFMQRHKIHRVLVMDGEKVAGIVTTTDITVAVAQHQLTKRVYVFDRSSGSRGW